MTKYKVLLQSENIDFVELNESLINDYLKIINDEEIQKRVSSKRRTFTYEEEFNKFFKDYEKVLLNEVIETRFNKQKNMWEFIYKNI